MATLSREPPGGFIKSITASGISKCPRALALEDQPLLGNSLMSEQSTVSRLTRVNQAPEGSPGMYKAFGRRSTSTMDMHGFFLHGLEVLQNMMLSGRSGCRVEEWHGNFPWTWHALKTSFTH